MGNPSPLHRDPDHDGDDYGAFSDEDNVIISNWVQEIISQLERGVALSTDEVLREMQELLRGIQGGTDTIVKENVAIALAPVMEEHGLNSFGSDIYGW